MQTLMRGKDLITLQEWSKGEIDTALETSKHLKLLFANGRPHRWLRDKTAFMMFFEQSTRTRNSMEAGITQLGGHAHDLTPDKMQLSHGESAKDTAMVLSRFGHAIAIRNCFYGIGNAYLREVARWASIPIINLQDDLYHPLQALADLMTMQETFGALDGLNVTISWAYATSHAKPLSVPLSQILLFTRYGMNVTVAAPKEFPLLPDLVRTAEANAGENGGTLRFVDDMDTGFEKAHVVIPKNWGGFAFTGDASEMAANLAKYPDWICNERRMALADPHAVYMHALPADRGKEVTDPVIDGPQSIIYDEAENRLHTVKGVMALTMGGRP
ncbi:ornithine carbamoyltransferase [bacterium]|nr:ornithine carbamoyltransferase [candidate division CSSED10-310 bacterium]